MSEARHAARTRLPYPRKKRQKELAPEVQRLALAPPQGAGGEVPSLAPQAERFRVTHCIITEYTERSRADSAAQTFAQWACAWNIMSRRGDFSLLTCAWRLCPCRARGRHAMSWAAGRAEREQSLTSAVVPDLHMYGTSEERSTNAIKRLVNLVVLCTRS